MSAMALSMLDPTSKAAQTTAAKAATASSTSSSDSDLITSADFMTLLVTEMKNQDPTQPTDPNAYIQQLVGVNSLQQLISINQDLTPTTSTAASSASKSAIGSVSAT